MVEQSIDTAITEAVAIQYNSFPYPNYPVFSKPRWQDSYMGSSLFVGNLLYKNTNLIPPILEDRNSKKHILVAGCGDTQPYILRKLEPNSFHLDCVDISKSSLRRAALRTFPYWINLNFIEEDLQLFARRNKEVYDHIDAWGVLNHLADCDSTLTALSGALKANGTARVMVYNSGAREWIHHLSSVFKLLDFSPYNHNDLNDARVLIWLLKRHMPDYGRHIENLGMHTIKNNAHFVDTFFHVRELRKSISEWFELFRQKGLIPFALWDRNAELDDLPNPLWSMPEAKQLESKVKQGVFTANLEVYLYKEDKSFRQESSETSKISQPSRWKFSFPPKVWKNYRELQNLGFFDSLKLWRNLFKEPLISPETKEYLSPEISLKRLARLGILNPRREDPFYKTLWEPITEFRSKNAETRAFTIVEEIPIPVTNFVSEVLLQKKRMDLRRLQLIEERLRRGSRYKNES